MRNLHIQNFIMYTSSSFHQGRSKSNPHWIIVFRKWNFVLYLLQSLSPETRKDVKNKNIFFFQISAIHWIYRQDAWKNVARQIYLIST